MNNLFAVDTSMETLETSLESLDSYETFSTTQAMQRKPSFCPIFRRHCLPSLLDGNESSSSWSTSHAEEDEEEDAAFMPWDEVQHQAIVQSKASSSQATRRCTSRTCPACRRPKKTQFVATNRRQCPPPPRLGSKWWESSTLTNVLADRLGAWVESQLTCSSSSSSSSSEERRFWREMDDEDDPDDTSTLPYDEKEGDPRYASF